MSVAVAPASQVNHLEHVAHLKTVASDLKHTWHQQHPTPAGSAVPRGSAPHLADQAFAHYADGVAKEVGISKQAVMSIRETGVPRGQIDPHAVVEMIDQDARQRSSFESKNLGGRVPGGVAAEFQTAAAKLHQAVEQIEAEKSTASSSPTQSSLLGHAADLKNVASTMKSELHSENTNLGGSVVPRGSDPQKVDQALAHVAEAISQVTGIPKNEVLGVKKAEGDKTATAEKVLEEVKADASAMAKKETEEVGSVQSGGAAANMQSAATKLGQVVNH